MRTSAARLTLAFVALTLLGGGAGVADERSGTDEPARARFLPYAGAPVDHFTWMGRFEGWQALSDDEVVIFFSANGAYLIKVWSPCSTRGLRFAKVVQLTTTVGGTVYARSDSLRVDGANCPISEIRPIDYKRLKQDSRAQHTAQPTPAAAPGTPPPR
jgi:Family of unknown function (DUF6491)